MTPRQLSNIEGHKWKKGQSGNIHGRPKNRIKELLQQFLPKGKVKKSAALTIEEINTIEQSVLSLELSDLQTLAKADETPAYAKILAVAAIIDLKNGRTFTIDKLRDRQYGKVTDKLEITGKDGAELFKGIEVSDEQKNRLRQILNGGE